MKLERRFLAIIITIGCLERASSVIHSQPHQNQALALKNRPLTTNVLVPKASLTQKGYIQFLKYVVDVPELTDYTFCIWVRSHNLTHNHPLLSYSKHEEERLIRVWISPLGTHVNLELLGMPIFSLPVNIVENEWYHICQSWNSFRAAWSLFMNGKLEATGHAPKLKNLGIDSGGDIVVGQEYTDFDKGLDDGIEGDISGFNLVLASTFSNVKAKAPHAPNRLFKREIKPLFDDPFFSSNGQFKQVMNLDQDFITEPKTSYDSPIYPNKGLPLKDYFDKPLGLLLVELSNDCGYLRGAPLSGRGVLVSWTKTDVRVFGGAILKTVPPFCVK